MSQNRTVFHRQWLQGIVRGTDRVAAGIPNVRHMHWSFMTAKRLDDRAVFLAIALFLGLPVAASAQYSGGEWRLPAGAVTGPTKAVQAERKPQVVIVQPTYPRSTVFRRVPGGGHNPYARPYGGASAIPAVVLNDGS